MHRPLLLKSGDEARKRNEIKTAFCSKHHHAHCTPFVLRKIQVYLKMAAANSKSLLRVYEKAEGIFQRLAALIVS